MFESAEAKKASGGGGAKKDVSAESGIYLKSFICPVCGEESKIPAVKSSSIRLIRNEPDFMPVYEGPNPLLYAVSFCPFCGFAAMPAALKDLTKRQKKLIGEKIGATWNYKKHAQKEYDLSTAIELHKLALYNAVVAGMKESAKAILSLRIGWLYRLAGDEASEKLFVATALEGFERAYGSEPDPYGSLDKNSMQYLVGELHRRMGNQSGALKWFKLVLVDRLAKSKIKDMARDQKDLIMETYGTEDAV